MSSHYAITTLGTCSDQQCISNYIQIGISGMVIVWIIFEFVMQIKLHMKIHFSWQEVMFVQMFLCLSFNICFALWSDVVIWYVLESLLYQIYFTTLVYYFTMKYLQKKIKFEQRKPYMVSLIIAYAIFCLAELGLFISLVNQGFGRCKGMLYDNKEIGEIIVNGVMIILGIVFFYLAYRNQTEELRKFQEFKVKTTSQNPLKHIWIWVCLNIVGQIFNQIQNCLVYDYYGHNQCTPVSSNLETDILSPIFMVCTYVLSFCSTLWLYHLKRVNQQQNLQVSYSTLQLASAQADIQNRVQIFKFSSNNESSLKNSLIQRFD